jgi:hypothetical protein
MTRFEEAALNETNMSIMAAFCIGVYLETAGICTFSKDELKKFIAFVSEDIEKWLKEDSES